MVKGSEIVTPAILGLAAGAAFTCFLLQGPYDLVAWVNSGDILVRVAAIPPPLLFVGASLTLFFRPALGYVLCLIAAIIALLFLVRTELLLPGGTNSWIVLNLSHDDHGSVLLSCTKIVATEIVLIAGLTSLLRLTPHSWELRGFPIWKRTWPSVALSLIVLATWFSRSVLPYRLPIIVDAVQPEIKILHVEKRGLQFHETVISVHQDSRFFVWRYGRRQLQYSFKVTGGWGVLPRDLRLRVTDVIDSPQLRGLKTHNPERLTDWNAEGWYVASPRDGIMSFSTEHGAKPPGNVLNLFNAIQHMPLEDLQEGIARDVCLGFCYDPTAGLGFEYINQRCRTDEKGITTCS